MPDIRLFPVDIRCGHTYSFDMMDFNDLFYLFVLLLFVALPVVLALTCGDRIGEAWERNRLRRHRRRHYRRSLSVSLPLREEFRSPLKAAEDRCEAIDAQISERLLSLQGLTVRAYRNRRSGSSRDLLLPSKKVKSLALSKEETINFLLDLACLQSDRIDAMVLEVDALSKAVGWPQPETGPSGVRDLSAGKTPQTAAAERLLKRIHEAGQKRRSIDERLKQFKSWRPPPPGTSETRDTPPDEDAGAKGSLFDVTIR